MPLARDCKELISRIKQCITAINNETSLLIQIVCWQAILSPKLFALLPAYEEPQSTIFHSHSQEESSSEEDELLAVVSQLHQDYKTNWDCEDNKHSLFRRIIEFYAKDQLQQKYSQLSGKIAYYQWLADEIKKTKQDIFTIIASIDKKINSNNTLTLLRNSNSQLAILFGCLDHWVFDEWMFCCAWLGHQEPLEIAFSHNIHDIKKPHSRGTTRSVQTIRLTPPPCYIHTQKEQPDTIWLTAGFISYASFNILKKHTKIVTKLETQINDAIARISQIPNKRKIPLMYHAILSKTWHKLLTPSTPAWLVDGVYQLYHEPNGYQLPEDTSSQSLLQQRVEIALLKPLTDYNTRHTSYDSMLNKFLQTNHDKSNNLQLFVDWVSFFVKHDKPQFLSCLLNAVILKYSLTNKQKQNPENAIKLDRLFEMALHMKKRGVNINLAPNNQKSPKAYAEEQHKKSKSLGDIVTLLSL